MADAACLLHLTCANKQEAETIARALLDASLIACASATPVESWFLWEGTTETSNEIMLIMKSRQDLFDEIDAKVAELHRYDTYVLEATPIERLSGAASVWLHKTLKK